MKVGRHSEKKREQGKKGAYSLPAGKLRREVEKTKELLRFTGAQTS